MACSPLSTAPPSGWKARPHPALPYLCLRPRPSASGGSSSSSSPPSSSLPPKACRVWPGLLWAS
eukprot:1515104-Alexandrium_andersonii.AAC.1